jgi:hypothetical protein
MIIVGFGLAFIAASVFFAWLGVQRWRASFRAKKARRSRVQYYKHQRGARAYSERTEPLQPARWY